jgi:hypothetical protein
MLPSRLYNKVSRSLIPTFQHQCRRSLPINISKKQRENNQASPKLDPLCRLHIEQKEDTWRRIQAEKELQTFKRIQEDQENRAQSNNDVCMFSFGLLLIGGIYFIW